MLRCCGPAITSWPTLTPAACAGPGGIDAAACEFRSEHWRALAGLVLAGHAGAELRIGLAAPLSGPSALLGEQMRAGAETAAATLRTRP